MNFQPNNDAKELIRIRADIGTVVGRYVSLKAQGRVLKGLCPFHKEKTPSFQVNPENGLFYCFGCGKGGDVFRFIQEIEGVGFREALEMLADETGVKLEKKQRQADRAYNDRYDDSRYDDGRYDDYVYDDNAPSPPSPSSQNNNTSVKPLPKPELLAIHNDAAEFFYQNVKGNRRVIDYFKSRGLTAETVKEFKLGYAPDGWTGLCDCLRGKGIPESAILQCGLAIRKDGGSAYDRFRNRVMFPLRDLSGRIIAFAGRGMDDDVQPKYLNSPETALYQKSRVLYGLHNARAGVRELGFLIIVEGYMDCLTLYQAGIRNAAAVSGTAFTADHAQIIKRFAKRVTLVFDGDRAGQAAAQRALPVLAPSNLQTSVLTLPEGDDPDSFVKREGPAAFNALIKTAKEAGDFLIDKLASESDGSPHGKSAAINELMPYARALADAIVRDAFLDKLALRLRVDKRHVYERFEKAPAPPISHSHENNDIAPANPVDMGRLEESFLRILITRPEFIVHARRYITPDFFTEDLPAGVYSIILEEYAKKGNLGGLPDLCAGGSETGRAISKLAVEPARAEDIHEELEQKIKLLRQKFFKAQIAEIGDALKSCPEEQKGELLEELKKYGTYLKQDLEQQI
jgi:DNA primase